MVGRARGEQIANGTYHGHITIAALLGNEILGVDTTPGETEAGPLDPVQEGLLTPLCNATSQGICLDGADRRLGHHRQGLHQHVLGRERGHRRPDGPQRGRCGLQRQHRETTDCQAAHGDSNVADATVGGAPGLHADAIEANSTSRKCKDGTQTQTNTSKVVNLQNAGLAGTAAHRGELRQRRAGHAGAHQRPAAGRL